MAVVAGVESAVQIHIDRGDDLNARDDKGQTPLMLAAGRNKTAVCKLLLAAGADTGLLDPTGRDALGIAQMAEAFGAVSAIEAACLQQPSRDGEPPLATNDEAASSVVTDPPALHLVTVAAEQPDQHPVPEPASATPEIAWVDGDDGDGFDLSGWEAEEEQVPPEGDPALAATAVEIQAAITEHEPIDTSADWGDIEALLPDRATPLPRADDAEARERLRLVLLRAIREGSVPNALIDDLTRGDDGEPDPEAGALLRMVINDLGAETDNRFEYWAPHENFEVFVAPEEKPDEEEAIDDAMAFVDELAERRNEPLRIYQREFQGEALLTAEAEVALGQAMERSLEKALDALASWPAGIAEVLDAAKKAASGAKPLRWLSSGPQVERRDAAPTSSTELDAESELPAEAAGTEDKSDSQFGLDAQESLGELEEFRANAQLRSGLTIGAGQDEPEWNACRGALASLGLTRGFLMALADSKLDETIEPALAFGQAIKAYRRARDRMTVANLKLVLSIAKKYLFTGQPLDDLLQEGNIGLIKAVDRYDWRLGFKFSTYATWWIRQQVGRYAADKCKTIRLPVHLYEKTQHIAQATRVFEREHGQSPTVDEIAELVGLPVKKVLALNRASMEPLPLHEIDGLDDCIAADAKDEYAARDPMGIVEDMQLVGLIDRLLGTIKAKEALILRMRYGIGIQESLTLEEIGTRLDVTRERIRQIEVKALQRLRHPTRIDTDDKADSDSDGLPETAKATAPKPKPAASRPERRTSSRPTALDKLLDHVREAGIFVEDRLEGDVRRVWVHITNAPDDFSRKIIRKLIAHGFEFGPGKGYWR
jgi:RNA polymerase primary sigma factor